MKATEMRSSKRVCALVRKYFWYSYSSPLSPRSYIVQLACTDEEKRVIFAGKSKQWKKTKPEVPKLRIVGARRPVYVRVSCVYIFMEI